MRRAPLICMAILISVPSLVLAQDHFTVRLSGKSYSNSPETRKLAFSPDGDQLAVSTTQGVYFIRTSDGELLRKYPSKAFSMVYSKDGSTIHLISTNGREWLDAQTGEKKQLTAVRSPGFVGMGLESRNGKILVVRTSPDGPVENSGKIGVGDEIIGVGQGETGSIVSVIAKTVAATIKLLQGDAGTIVRVVVIPKGKIEEETVTIRRMKRELVDGKYVFSAKDVSTADENLAWCMADGFNRLTNAKDGTEVSSFRARDVNNDRGLPAISRNNKLFVLVSRYVNPPKELADSFRSSSSGNSGRAGSGTGVGSSVLESTRKELRFSASNLLYGVEIRDAATGEHLKTFPIEVEEPGFNPYFINGVGFDPTSQSVAVGMNKTVRFYDVETGKQSRVVNLKIDEGNHGVNCFSLFEDFAAIGDTSGKLRIYNVKSNKFLHAIPCREEGAIEKTAFSDDGKLLAFCIDGVAHIVDVSEFTK